ncbi:MAG: Lipopolysaccharide core heptosyltransferase RfaQ [Pelotomaculum sp. PtaU1.Bin065]|nr:MAG: Lipopolysaccharide core heptosyltransferase RfaQ [Pelotomaculum sp. PtaU1.Bin065]
MTGRLAKSAYRYSYVTLRRLLLLYLHILDELGELFFSRKRPVFSRPHKIIVSEIGHIGDLIFSTPVFSIIKNNFPDSHIYALINPVAQPLLEGNPYIDGILTYDHFRLSRNRVCFFKKMYRTIREYGALKNHLRVGGFDLGLDLRHFYPTTIQLLVLGGVGFVAGFGNRGHGYLLDKKLSLCPDLHEVEQKVHALAQLGLRVPPKEHIKLQIYLEEEVEDKIRKLLSSSGIDANWTICVIHPGCGQRARLWTNEGWARVADFLVKQSIQVIFTGGNNEKSLIQDIKNILGPKNHCLDLSGALSLKELMALIKLADFFMGLESAPSHIAAAVETPVICLYSGTTRTNQWKPWGGRVFVITKELACAPCYNPLGCRLMSCLRDIKAEDVIEIIKKEILPKPKKSRGNV